MGEAPTGYTTDAGSAVTATAALTVRAPRILVAADQNLGIITDNGKLETNFL